MTAPVPQGDAALPGRRLIRTAFALYVLALAVICAWQRRVLFAWPAGIVTGNLLASAIWAPLAVIHLDKLTRRQHRSHAALARRQHEEHLALAQRHHEEHMAALSRHLPCDSAEPV